MPFLKKPAPSFTLPDATGKMISLQGLLAKRRWIILYFYPKDNTPGCTLEAQDFTSHSKEFAKLNSLVVGISPDSCKSHCQFIAKQKLKVMLLCDEQRSVVQQYHVWQKKKFMGREYMGVVRTTFLINPQGKIVHLWNNVKIKGHAQEVLQRLQQMSQEKNVSKGKLG